MAFKVSANFTTASSLDDLKRLVTDGFRQVENFLGELPEFYVVNVQDNIYPAKNVNIGSILIDQTTTPYTLKSWNGTDWEKTGGKGEVTTPTTPGMTNPMTSLGDLIVGDAEGTPGRLAIGTAGQILKVVDDAVAWADSPTTGSGNQNTDAALLIGKLNYYVPSFLLMADVGVYTNQGSVETGAYGGAVACWKDQSLKGNDFYQTSSDNGVVPGYVTSQLNGRSAVSFEVGRNMICQRYQSMGLSAFSWILVWQPAAGYPSSLMSFGTTDPTTTSTENFYYAGFEGYGLDSTVKGEALRRDGKHLYGLTGSTAGSYRTSCVVCGNFSDVTQSTLFYNNSPSDSHSSSTGSDGTVSVMDGFNIGLGLQGTTRNVALALMYPFALTDTQRNDIHSAIGTYYDITMSN